jgi:hypothetical protein
LGGLETDLNKVVFVEDVLLLEMTALEPAMSLDLENVLTNYVEFANLQNQFPLVVLSSDIGVRRSSEDPFELSYAFGY